MSESSFDAAEEARNLKHHPEFALLQTSTRNRLSPKLRQRYELVRLFVKLQSISEVAKKKGVDRKTVRKWISRFQAHGIAGLADQPRTGRHSMIDEHLQQRIRAALTEPVPEEYGLKTWQAKALAQHLGLPYHPLLRYLKKEGIRLNAMPASSTRLPDVSRALTALQSAQPNNAESSSKTSRQ